MTVSRETLSLMAGVDVSRETFDQLVQFVDLLLVENEQQNLVARSSIAEVWSRHIADSLQLVRFAPIARSWLDIGSGPGLPGLVIAIATGTPVLLVEPRRLRTDFLARAVAALGLTNVRIATTSIAHVHPEQFDAITARAFAALPRLFEAAAVFSSSRTIWVLPKGRSAAEEVASARPTWQGRFEIIPSRTDTNAGIVVARDVRRRSK